MNNLEDRSMRFFRNEQDRSGIDMHFENIRLLGEGGYGRVYAVRARLGKCLMEMAVKSFHPNRLHVASRAVERHRLVRRAGLKTFSTYRLSDDGDNVLMPSVEKGGWQCTEMGGDQRCEPLSLPEAPIHIDGLDSFLSDLWNQVVLASQHGLVLHHSCYFFLLKILNPDTIKLDFLIGDFDEVGLADGREHFLEGINSAITWLALSVFWGLQLPSSLHPQLRLAINSFEEKFGRRPFISQPLQKLLDG